MSDYKDLYNVVKIKNECVKLEKVDILIDEANCCTKWWHASPKEAIINKIESLKRKYYK